ncbi:unnamed protein product, partial [Meganyctiphanes norvegica]
MGSAMGSGGMNSAMGAITPITTANTTSSSMTHSMPTSPSTVGGMGGFMGNMGNGGASRPPMPSWAGMDGGSPWWGDYGEGMGGMERGRSRNWTYEETLELIQLYTSDEWQNKFSSEKKNHRAIWAGLAGALSRRKDVSGDEARQRLNNLKALYNRTRRQLLAGEISSPQWEYWEPLHAFLGRPQPFLPMYNPAQATTPPGRVPGWGQSSATPPFSGMGGFPSSGSSSSSQHQQYREHCAQGLLGALGLGGQGLNHHASGGGFPHHHHQRGPPMAPHHLHQQQQRPPFLTPPMKASPTEGSCDENSKDG